MCRQQRRFEMPKYRVSLDYTQRFIDADDADEACDRFRDDETIFYELEATELVEIAPGIWGAGPMGKPVGEPE